MADNLALLNDDVASQGNLALDEVTYSGDTAYVGVTRVVHVSGAEGSKAVSEIFFAEDAAHTTGDFGVQTLAVRNDTLAALAGTDGDYSPLQVNASGALYAVLATNSGVDIGDVDILSIAAGDNNIGNVDIVTLPAGNLGQQAMAASLSVVPASDITDATYIGDIKFGEALPTGANTIGAVTIAAAQTLATVTTVATVTTITNDVNIADGGNSITVDNGGTFAVQIDAGAVTSLALIDDAIFADDAAFTLTSSKMMIGGAIRDDSLSALAAVEGDVVPFRVNSTGALHVTGAGGGTQYQIDDAGGATDTGTLALAIRDDSLTTLTPVDGDYVGLRVSSTGALHVTGGGGGTEYTEDVATANPIVGTATLMERDDALTTVTPLEGDWIGLRGSAEGALWVQDFNSDAILVDTTSIDGKITACDTGAVVISSGTVTTVSTVTNLSQLSGQAIPTFGTTTYAEATSTGVLAGAVRNDTLAALANTDNEVAPLQVNATGALYVSVDGTVTVGSHAVTNAGTFAVQVDGAALTALQLIDDAVYTHDAAGGTAVGNMMMAQRDDEVGATATTTTDGDAQALTANKFGQLKTTQLADATSEIKYAVIDAASSGDNTIQAAAGAGVKIRVLAVFMIAAGTVTARFESGAAGTALTGQMNLAVNTGFVLPFNPGGWFETADNTLLNLELSGAISVDGCLTYVEV